MTSTLSVPKKSAMGFRTAPLTQPCVPELVPMDIRLPDIDGVEALRRLKVHARTASIPVLALTAQAMRGDRERFLAAGFDGYVSKPVDVVALLRMARSHCDGRRP